LFFYSLLNSIYQEKSATLIKIGEGNDIYFFAKDWFQEYNIETVIFGKAFLFFSGTLLFKHKLLTARG